MPKALLRCLALLALLASTSGQAQTAPKVTEIGGSPKSFLFVGNSFFYYNNSLHAVFIDFVHYDAKRNGFKQSGFARLFQAL